MESAALRNNGWTWKVYGAPISPIRTCILYKSTPSLRRHIRARSSYSTCSSSIPTQYQPPQSPQIPSNISFEEASTVSICLSTAAIGMYGELKKEHGGAGLTPPWEEGGRGKYQNEPLVVTGGSTCVGMLGKLNSAQPCAKFSPMNDLLHSYSISEDVGLQPHHHQCFSTQCRLRQGCRGNPCHRLQDNTVRT